MNKKLYEKNMDRMEKNISKVLTRSCYRDTFIEELHAGVFPDTKTGDYSDVKIITPTREIAWNDLSRISDIEMKKLNKEVCNNVYSTIKYLREHKEFFVQVVAFFMGNDLMADWDDPIDSESIELKKKKIKRPDKKDNISGLDMYLLRMM